MSAFHLILFGELLVFVLCFFPLPERDGGREIEIEREKERERNKESLSLKLEQAGNPNPKGI